MTVALWTSYHYSPTYDLFGTEAEAASRAADMDDNAGEYGVVLGIQYDDGHAVDRDEWPALAGELERREETRQARAAAYVPGPVIPQKTIKDPFLHFALDADLDAPSWLGS